MNLSTEKNKKNTVCAHRGFSLKYPENSMEAFEAAIAVGADEIELDVRLSADGVLTIY